MVHLVLAEEVALALRPGLTVITGDTGAGKSLLVDAIGALVGRRIERDQIRTGEISARCEGVFTETGESSGESRLHELLEESGLELEDGTLLLTRELAREGPSVARVNGRTVPVSTLRRLGEVLVDIQGQQEHLSILRPLEQLRVLDRYGVLDGARVQCETFYSELRRLREETTRLSADDRLRAEREELLRFQVSEIEGARLSFGEEDLLEREHRLLSSARRRLLLAAQAHDCLMGDGGELSSAIELLARSQALLAELEAEDSSVAAQRLQAQEILDAGEELARQTRRYRDAIEDDPARLAGVEERLDLIGRLQRKYGGSVEAVLAYAQRAFEELELLAAREERLAAVADREVKLLGEIGRVAGELSRSRREVAKQLEAAIAGEMGDLGLERARVEVTVRQEIDSGGLPIDGREGAPRYALRREGIDQVDFLLAANPGEPPRPLGRVASGGELSRVLLAVEAALGDSLGVPVLVCDELEMGVGGRSGHVVGEKLWRLARQRQILCVTHLAQVAAYGDHHVLVEKREVAGRTRAEFRSLDEPARARELAAMLGGTGGAALRNADGLIEKARRWKAIQGEGKAGRGRGGGDEPPAAALQPTLEGLG